MCHVPSCLQAFEMMQQQGFRPDACVYNVVLEALVSSGLVSAQVKAVQLCAAAVSRGELACAGRAHAALGAEQVLLHCPAAQPSINACI